VKGVVLAGGTGSRLYPLTKVTNKHLLPVGRYPMIFHPIAKLAEVGIRDILVVTGTDHMGAVVGTLGSGREYGLEFTYRVQDEPGGIAQALGLARGFVGPEGCVVILGDNIFQDSLAPYVERFRRQGGGARILLKQVPDPQRFGVVALEDGRVVDIQEKPADPPTDLAVTGIYMYGPEVFDIIPGLRPSARGELEITDVNRAFLARGRLEYDVLEGWWTDAGTPASFALANRLAADLTLPLFERR
jgi:glucose-1-phosphate thymidylyltransferase